MANRVSITATISREVNAYERTLELETEGE